MKSKAELNTYDGEVCDKISTSTSQPGAITV